MTLYFHNPGEIDIRGATIMGLNAKEQPDGAIGFFGTGLKYSIACIIRWGGEITIYSGEQAYAFTSEKISFREKEFSQIMIRREGDTIYQSLGFTTEYGKSWEAWQVLRELLSNARDEDGDVSDRQVAPMPGTTVIIINCPVLEAEYNDRDFILLPVNQTWDFVGDGGRLRKREASSVYYRSVRVLDRETALTYDITKGLTLTEDRTVKSRYEVSREMSKLLGECTDRDALVMALSREDGIEYELDFDIWGSYSSEFLDVATELYRKSPNKHKRFKQVLAKFRPESITEAEVELRPVQQLALQRAIKLVDRMGMPASSVTIKIVELGNDVLGEYRTSTGYVYLDPKVFEQGTKQLVATLYEELLHKTSGFEDCCYEMQNHLFNLIVSLHEEHVFKEPC